MEIIHTKKPLDKKKLEKLYSTMITIEKKLTELCKVQTQAELLADSFTDEEVEQLKNIPKMANLATRIEILMKETGYLAQRKETPGNKPN